MKLKHVAAIALCMVIGSAWADAGKPLARLGKGEVISEQDLSDYLARRVDLRQTARNAWGVEAAVQEMAMTRALVLEGERLGVPRKADSGTPLRFDDVYGLSVYRTQAPACEAPANEEEARKYYDAHQKAFVLPSQARVQRIILPANTQIGGGSALAWLQDQAQAIADGKRQFGIVAMRAQGEYALDTQGDLGWITLEGDHAMMRALQTVAAGDMLGPVQDGEFVYLFSVLQKREARQLTWEEAKSFVATRAVSYCRQEAQANLRADLFKRYGVEIDRSAIRELSNRTSEKASESPAEKAGENTSEKVEAKPQ